MNYENNAKVLQLQGITDKGWQLLEKESNWLALQKLF